MSFNASEIAEVIDQDVFTNNRFNKISTMKAEPPFDKNIYIIANLYKSHTSLLWASFASFQDLNLTKMDASELTIRLFKDTTIESYALDQVRKFKIGKVNAMMVLTNKKSVAKDFFFTLTQYTPSDMRVKLDE